jgi:tRNA-binding EMAP/Myf-like protein
VNLKPVKLRGILSEGMLLAAGGGDVKGLVTLVEEVDDGTIVR